jgi:diphthamide synthase subunit DPH2
MKSSVSTHSFSCGIVRSSQIERIDERIGYNIYEQKTHFHEKVAKSGKQKRRKTIEEKENTFFDEKTQLVGEKITVAKQRMRRQIICMKRLID